MARQKDQAARRRELVHAAARAIVDVGLAGLRVRDVAERADTSPGLVSYYFPDISELVLEVHADAVRRFYLARRNAIAGIADSCAQLLELARLGVPTSPEDLLCRVLYEFHVHAARSGAHSVLMASLWEQEVSLYDVVLNRGVERGAFTLRAPARQVAETAVALEDAVGLHVVGKNASVTPAVALEMVVGLLERETAVTLRAPA